MTRRSPKIDVYTSMPTSSVWDRHIREGRPFVARRAFRCDVTLKRVVELAGKTPALVRDQVTTDIGETTLSDLVQCLGEKGKTWYAPQQQLPDVLKKRMPWSTLPKVVLQGMQPNMWLGAKGGRTLIHRDLFHNAVIELDGIKEFTLLSPKDDHCVYPKPFSGRYGNHPAIESIKSVDVAAFPAFREARPIVVRLSPGDVLFVPVFWWHEVHLLTHSLMLNTWWPAPLDVVLRPDLQEIIPSSERFFDLLGQSCQLAPIRTDAALVAKLLERKFALFAAIVLGSVAVDVIRELQARANVSASVGPWAAVRELTKAGAIDEATSRVLTDIRADVVAACDVLGRSPPYPQLDTARLLPQLRKIASASSVAARNTVCRTNESWAAIKGSSYVG